VQPLAQFENDLLAQERNKIITLAEEMQQTNSAGAEWTCSYCFLNNTTEAAMEVAARCSTIDVSKIPESAKQRLRQNHDFAPHFDLQYKHLNVNHNHGFASAVLGAREACAVCMGLRQNDFAVPEAKLPPVGTMPGAGAVVSTTYGKGNLVLFSPHPELTQGDGDKCNPMELIHSAACWAACRGPRDEQLAAAVAVLKTHEPAPSNSPTEEGAHPTTQGATQGATSRITECAHLAIRDGEIPSSVKTLLKTEPAAALCLQCFEMYSIAHPDEDSGVNGLHNRFLQGSMEAHCRCSGHSVAAGLADLSYFCFECDGYLDPSVRTGIPDLTRFNAQLEYLKFGRFPEDYVHEE
jgi:hypothetical protein